MGITIVPGNTDAVLTEVSQPTIHIFLHIFFIFSSARSHHVTDQDRTWIVSPTGLT